MSKSGAVSREYHEAVVSKKSKEIAAVRKERDILREALERIAETDAMSMTVHTAIGIAREALLRAGKGDKPEERYEAPGMVNASISEPTLQPEGKKITVKVSKPRPMEMLHDAPTPEDIQAMYDRTQGTREEAGAAFLARNAVEPGVKS